MRTAGRYALHLARKRERAFLGRLGLRVLWAAAAYLAIVVLTLWLPFLRSLPVAFRQGGLLVGLGWFIREIQGIAGQGQVRMGGEAERWTSSRFRHMRGMVSQVIDSVSFEEFDVDHVAVGPNGVFAVETKYTQSEWWRKRGGGPDVPPEWIERSRSAARKIRLFLGTKGVGRVDHSRSAHVRRHAQAEPTDRPIPGYQSTGCKSRLNLDALGARPGHHRHGPAPAHVASG